MIFSALPTYECCHPCFTNYKVLISAIKWSSVFIQDQMKDNWKLVILQAYGHFVPPKSKKKGGEGVIHRKL